MTDSEKPGMTRRAAMAATGGVAGSMLLHQQIGAYVQTVKAQTQEPRIELGDDYVIDDRDGDFAIEHLPSGDRIVRDDNGWKIVQDVTLDGDLDADGNDISGVGALSTDNLTVNDEPSDDHWEEIDTFGGSSNSISIPSKYEDGVIKLRVRALDAEEITLRMADETGSDYRYEYREFGSRSTITDDDKFMLLSEEGSFNGLAGVWFLDVPRYQPMIYGVGSISSSVDFGNVLSYGELDVDTDITSLDIDGNAGIDGEVLGRKI